MKYFLDTEFIEDGKTIDLISIGIVSEDGRSYYAEFAECELEKASPWVKENVFPHLTGTHTFRNDIREAILKFFVGNKVEMWGYYADYDWVAFCQIFGRMIDLPKGYPMFCRDLRQLAGSIRLPEQKSEAHNALADAMWVKDSYEWLAINHPEVFVGG
jgi:hypothetical protein